MGDAKNVMGSKPKYFVGGPRMYGVQECSGGWVLENPIIFGGAKINRYIYPDFKAIYP